EVCEPDGREPAAAPPPPAVPDRPEHPPGLSDIVGQKRTVEWLEICARAAQKTGRPMEHALLSGGPGLGKTTIARILAKEMGVGFTETTATTIRTPAHFLGMLVGLRPRDVLFIDEVHGLDGPCQDFLLSALDRRRIHLVISEGAQTRAVIVELEPFTLIAATTDPAHLTQALRSRFAVQHELVSYSEDEIGTIIARAVTRAGERIARAAARELARRSRGNAREALRLLGAARILAQVSEASEISRDIALRSVAHLGIDDHGLRPEERRLLTLLVEERRAIGLRTIADSLDADEKTIREIHEPHLVREGWIRRTPWGRMATKKAIAWLKAEAPPMSLAGV
ncbi:MAG: Holliday junction branch migration DNA helicase RuvB, partial [Planctomycetes bacterium]|nr:Holliday junction branch migration DNA helicase RuvB [Planctomycetota bacterium]